jgi:serine phosphatase RsbU (regulator of sigma subunit)
MKREPGNKRQQVVKRTASLLLFALMTIPLGAQAEFPGLVAYNQDSAMAASLYMQARTRFEADSMEPALELAVEALHSSMQSNQEDSEFASLSLIAAVYERLGRAGDAIPYYMRMVNILESRQDTTALASAYTSIAEDYHAEEVYDKEGEYYLKVLVLLPESNHRKRAGLTEKIGIALMQDGLLDSAVLYLDQARSLYGQSGEDDTRILNLLVQASNREGHYQEALRYNGILFSRYREEGDYGQMSVLKNNMAYDLTLTGDYESAASSYGEAIEYGEQAGLPEADQARLQANAGICYQNMGRDIEVKKSFQQAIKLFDEAGEPAEKSRIENIVALIYYHEGDLYNASLFSRNSIASAREAGDAEKLSDACLTYSRILRQGNDPIQALEYYEKYLNIRDSLQMEEKIREQELSQRRNRLERSENDLRIKLKEEQVRELAIQQLTLQLEKEEQEKELIKKEKDMQLLEQERLRQSLVITRQQNAAEKQKRENQILEQEKRITGLRLEQETRVKEQREQEILLLEREKELDQMELARQKSAKKVLIGFSIMGLLITLLIIGGLISSRRKNMLLARQKQEIEEKNKDLESKNEEISAQRDEIEAQRDLVFRQKDEIEQYNSEVMKSIEYARKIQASTLPDLTSLNTSISEFFVFFRPRDIVSGDFFWTANVENSTVLTVSDCTGHGVPGAFMSMLGMSLLKEIVQKEFISHPGVILRRLRKGIISALGQKGISGEQRDGMDMALVSINHETNIIQYSGAYNPLYLARRKENAGPAGGSAELFDEKFGNGYLLYEIRADKMPIGHYVHMDKFETHDVEIMEGDVFYLFTDGYADQFGGPMGKKFKYKSFKRLLLKNAHLPMEEQRQILNDTLDEWMGNIAQVDDICVMGLRMGRK